LKINGIILAGGSSSRMTKNKQLLTYKGQSFIARLIDYCSELALEEIICVTGYLHDELKAEINNPAIRLVPNENHRQGLLSSLQVGVSSMNNEDACDGILVMLTDQPLIPLSHYQRLMEEANWVVHSIVATAYNDTYGAPAIFMRSHFTELLDLPEGASPKSLIQKNLETTQLVYCQEAGRDIDTDVDYKRLISS